MEWNSETCRISSRPARWRHFRPLGCSFGLGPARRTGLNVIRMAGGTANPIGPAFPDKPAFRRSIVGKAVKQLRQGHGHRWSPSSRCPQGNRVPLTCLGDHPETVLFSLLRTFTHCRRTGSLCSTVFDTECFGDTEHDMSVTCGLGPISTRLKQCPIKGRRCPVGYAVVQSVASVDNSASIPHKTDLARRTA